MKLDLTPAQASWLRNLLQAQRDSNADLVREHGHRYYCEPEMARAFRYNVEQADKLLHQLNEAEVEMPPTGTFR